MTLKILKSMNDLCKERLEQFIWGGGDGEEKWKCSTVQNNELYEECTPKPIYAFPKRKKKKVVLTEIKQHIQNPHKEIFFACHL